MRRRGGPGDLLERAANGVCADCGLHVTAETREEVLRLLEDHDCTEDR